MSEINLEVKKYASSCLMLRNCADGSEVRVSGVISTIKKINTKKGDAMMFVKIEDTTGDLEVLVFPRLLEKNPHMWQPDNIVICSGTISDKDGERKVLCDSATVIDKINLKQTLDNFLITSREQKSKRRVFFKNENGNSRPAKVKKEEIKEQSVILKISTQLSYELSLELKKIVLQSLGNDPLILVFNQDGTEKKVKTTFRINYGSVFQTEIEKIFGQASVFREN